MSERGGRLVEGVRVAVRVQSKPENACEPICARGEMTTHDFARQMKCGVCGMTWDTFAYEQEYAKLDLDDSGKPMKKASPKSEEPRSIDWAALRDKSKIMESLARDMDRRLRAYEPPPAPPRPPDPYVLHHATIPPWIEQWPVEVK